jgi:hypothetical protein
MEPVLFACGPVAEHVMERHQLHILGPALPCRSNTMPTTVALLQGSDDDLACPCQRSGQVNRTEIGLAMQIMRLRTWTVIAASPASVVHGPAGSAGYGPSVGKRTPS